MICGELPLDEHMVDTSTNRPNEEQIALLNRGMQNMVGMLGSIVQALEYRKLN